MPEDVISIYLLSSDEAVHLVGWPSPHNPIHKDTNLPMVCTAEALALARRGIALGSYNQHKLLHVWHMLIAHG